MIKKLHNLRFRLNGISKVLFRYFCILFCSACIVDAEANMAYIQGPIKLILPKLIYAVVGIEANIYFDNIVLSANNSNYVFDVTCDKGIQQRERWTYVPAENDTGSYRFLLEVRDHSNSLVARAESIIYVVPESSAKEPNITMLCIGDSLTQASEYTHHLLQLTNKQNGLAITLVGSHAPDSNEIGNRHEGYGGWTAKQFATYHTGLARANNYVKQGSPFMYEDDKKNTKLDFARYCEEFNDGNAPDFVTIFLGANDIFKADDKKIENSIDEMFVYYDILLKMIHEFNRETVIGVLLLVPPAASQDAFGANYACGQTQWQYKRNQFRLVERMLKHYGNREKDNIYIVPTNVNLDCVHNYPTQKVACNTRTSEQITRLVNGIHPSKDGYYQIGDTIYCWVKAQLK